MKKNPPESAFSVAPDGTRTLVYTVMASDAGRCLVEALSARFPSYRREDWISAIASGALTLDDAVSTSDAVLSEGMCVVYRAAPAPEPDVDAAYTILFEDEHLAVVDKSGNLPCHPAGRYFEHTLTRMLVARNDFPAAFVVNRLDRETSGLVLVAKSQAAASRCGQALMAGQFDKRYLVLSEGVWTRAALGKPYPVCGFIRLECGTVVRKKRVFTEGDADPRGQVAETIFTLLAVKDGLSLLEVELVTGRPHQIRATLKALAHPVVGDKLYGVDETIYARLCEGRLTAEDKAALRLPRQALHSWKLAFRHPFTGADLAIVAPAPFFC